MFGETGVDTADSSVAVPNQGLFKARHAALFVRLLGHAQTAEAATQADD